MYRLSFCFRNSNPGTLFALLTLVLVISSCTRTQPVTYYQLSTSDSCQTAGDAIAIGDSVIGLGPMRLPEALERPQIVSRQSSNRLQLSDSQRWIEPLAENIYRVLRENLSVLLDTERFLIYPWSRAIPADYQIIIEIIRFESTGYQTVSLEAVWSIRDKTAKVIILPQKRSSYQVRVMSPDYEELVRALSETLCLFCREIAQELSNNFGEK